MNIKNNNRGFSLAEILVVLVIGMVLFGILAMNRTSKVKNAYYEEARVFINFIAEQERTYFAASNKYLYVDVPSAYVADLGVDLNRNSYYGKFTVDISTNTPFTVFNPQITVTLFGKNEMADSKVVGTYDFAEGKVDIKYQ